MGVRICLVSLTDRAITRLKLDTCETMDGFTDIGYYNYGCHEINLTVSSVVNFVETLYLNSCYSIDQQNWHHLRVG